MRIFIAFGTRPEAIKLAPLIKRIQCFPQLDGVVCNTGQHRTMVDQVLKFFGISVQCDLNVMTFGQDLFRVTREVLRRIEGVMKQEKPDIVVVQGDTTSGMTCKFRNIWLDIPFPLCII